MQQNSRRDPIEQARTYQDGVRTGLATAALALSVVAFINLLGIEKVLLAGLLGFFALRGGLPGGIAARRARIALVIAAAYAVTFVVVLAVFHAQLHEIILSLHRLG